MHKQAMEMAKHAMADACAKGYDCMTPQDWDDLKDCVEAAEKAIKADYYYMIVCAMKEEEEYEKQEEKWLLKELKEKHGMSEEDSRRFYDAWRYKNGRFAPKGRGARSGYEEPPYWHMMPDYDKAEHDRDLDRKDGKMYYTNPSGERTGYSDGYSDGYREGEKTGKGRESRYDRAKRGYEEIKQQHKGNSPEDKALTMKEAEKFTNIAIDELMEALEDTSPEVKNMVKTKVISKMQNLK